MGVLTPSAHPAQSVINQLPYHGFDDPEDRPMMGDRSCHSAPTPL